MASIYQEWFSALSPLIAALIVVIGGTFLTLKYQKRKDEKEYRFKLGEVYDALLDEIRFFITSLVKQSQTLSVDKLELIDKNIELMFHLSRISFNFNILLHPLGKEIKNPFLEIDDLRRDIGSKCANLIKNTTRENFMALFKKLTNLIDLLEEKLAPIISGHKVK